MPTPRRPRRRRSSPTVTRISGDGHARSGLAAGIARRRARTSSTPGPGSACARQRASGSSSWTRGNPFAWPPRGTLPWPVSRSTKFHVLRHLSDALDQFRKREYARVSGRQRRSITRQKYTLLPLRENLTSAGPPGAQASALRQQASEHSSSATRTTPGRRIPPRQNPHLRAA